ncbi:MAG: hypothetical protein MUF54_16010 [Polyangiaceae bacterium]|jgi:hypothetical protein|nr:hypothetical protein [Polyangiaceae bacterium]
MMTSGGGFHLPGSLATVLVVSWAGCAIDDGSIDLLPSKQATSCTDGRLDGDETDLDCGGSCAGCGEGETCEEDADCQDGFVCLGTKCRAK